MQSKTKRLFTYVGITLFFATIGFFATRRALAVPIGTADQCAASTDSCQGTQWVYLGTKTVYCCCAYADYPQHWFQCVITIQVFINREDKTEHCYRETKQDRTDTSCTPLPHKENNNTESAPKTFPVGGCCK